MLEDIFLESHIKAKIHKYAMVTVPEGKIIDNHLDFLSQVDNSKVVLCIPAFHMIYLL